MLPWARTQLKKAECMFPLFLLFQRSPEERLEACGLHRHAVVGVVHLIGSLAGLRTDHGDVGVSVSAAQMSLDVGDRC
jgi:hypothetical protein